MFAVAINWSLQDISAQRFFRFRLWHLAVLTMVVGAFFAGRRTLQMTIQSLKERAFAAEIVRDDLQRRMRQEYDSQRLNSQLRIRANEVLKMVAEPSYYQVIQVVAGDTIRVMIGEEEQTIVLYGIDCPDIEQPFGTDARDFTSRLCERTRGHVRVIDRARDGNGDIVAIVLSGSGDIINDELVRAGWARLDHEQFLSPTLHDWQVVAQESKKGLWAE